ncbi:hypothetical protein LXL04_023803 [Taraxacum kok-saghyz]
MARRKGLLAGKARDEVAITCRLFYGEVGIHSWVRYSLLAYIIPTTQTTTTKAVAAASNHRCPEKGIPPEGFESQTHFWVGRKGRNQRRITDLTLLTSSTSNRPYAEIPKPRWSREPENSPNFLYLPNRYSFQKTDFGNLQNVQIHYNSLKFFFRKNKFFFLFLHMCNFFLKFLHMCNFLFLLRTIIKFENGGTNLDRYKSHTAALRRQKIDLRQTGISGLDSFLRSPSDNLRTIIKFENGGTNLDRYKSHCGILRLIYEFLKNNYRDEEQRCSDWYTRGAKTRRLALVFILELDLIHPMGQAHDLVYDTKQDLKPKTNTNPNKLIYRKPKPIIRAQQSPPWFSAFS